MAIFAQILSSQSNSLRKLKIFINVHKHIQVKVKVKVIVYSCYGTPCHSYRVSLAILDHTVLPSTRHKWTHRAFTAVSSQEQNINSLTKK